MATQVWVRRKVNLCEYCGRVMDNGEAVVLDLQLAKLPSRAPNAT